MGQHHSRPKTPVRNVPADRGGDRIAHRSHEERETSTTSHWWSSNKTKSSSEPQPASARLRMANPATSTTQPQTISDQVSPSIERSGKRLDSLKPLEGHNKFTGGSGPSGKVYEILTTPYTQTQECSLSLATSPVPIETSHSATTPKNVLKATNPPATSSSTLHDHVLTTGRRFPLSTQSSHPAHGAATELYGDLETPSSLRLIAQIARDHDIASLLQEEEDSRRAAASRPPSKDCAVCCESVHPLQFPANPPSGECTHPADVCFSCLQQWVATKLDASSRAVIDCPQCTTTLTHEDVRRACNFETFARYDRLAALNVINGMEDFHWCLRPGCTAGQEHISRIRGFMRCHACNYEQCLRHKTRWHRGESCAQYDARVNNKTHEHEERESTKLMDEQQSKIRLRECPNIRCKNRIGDGQEVPEKCPKQGCNTSLEREPVWKKCPSCQTLIEKRDGCDQMRCQMTNCRQKFCWQCLAKWEDMLKHREIAHSIGCKYRKQIRYPYGYNG